MWVTIWVCIKVFRNKAGLTCKGGGRRRQLPPRREFPPLIFLLAVRIIQTSQQLTVLLFGTTRIKPVTYGRPGCNETPAYSEQHAVAVAVALLGRDASPGDAITCCVPHLQAAFIVARVQRSYGHLS